MALAIALLCSAGAWAQTDVTSTYMTNPSFEAANATTGDISATGVFTNDWNITSISYARVAVFNSSSTISTFGGTSSVSNGNYYLMIRSNLDQGKTQNIRQNSDMALPKGKYSIYFDYKAARVKNVARKFTISAINSGGSTTYGSIAIDIPQRSANNAYFSDTNWSTASFEFTHESTTNTRINISCETQGTANSPSSQHTVVLLDNFVIKYSNINGSTLALLIAQATAINGKLGTLTSEIATAQGVYDGINDTPAYQETIDNAISTLQSAINTKVAAYSFDPAGDDVTSFIFRPGFEGMTPESANYGTAKGKDYSSEGWTMVETGDFGYGAIMSYGSEKTFNSASVPATDNAGNTGNTLGVSVGWGSTQRYQSEVITLPAGSYRLSVKAYNANAGAQQFTSKVGFVPTSGESSLSSKTSFTSNTWETDEIDFVLDNDTEGRFQIGGTAVSGGSGDNAKIFFDNISLTYFDPLKLAQIQWQEVWNNLNALDETALPNAAETAITDALAETEPTTVEGCNTAKAALQALIDSYDDIKAAYTRVNDFINDVTGVKDNSAGDKDDIEAAISDASSDKEDCTDVDGLNGVYDALETACQTYVTSGAEPAAEHPFEVTFKIVNPSFENDKKETSNPAGWTIPNKGNQYGAKAKGSMSNVEGNYYFNNWQSWWQDCNVEQTISSLPNGRYEVTAVLASYNGTSANLQAGSGSTDTNMTGENNGIRVSVNGDVTSSSLTIRARAGRKNDGSLLRVDDFTLSFIGLKPVLSDLITSATALTTTNVGNGAFQIPSSAASTLSGAIETAQGVYDSSAYGSTIQDAIDELKGAIETFQDVALNVPAEGDAFNLYLVDGLEKTVTFKAGNESSGGYAIGYTDDAGSFYNQAIHFKSTGTKNQYKLYIIDDAGTKHYLCTGTVYDGGTDSQIRVTDNEENALAVEVIATTTNGIYNLKNTAADALIGSNGDTGVYTAQTYKNFNINPAAKCVVPVAVNSGKWSTRIFPFAVAEVPAGLEVYTATDISGASIVMSDELSSIPANTPVLIKATTDVDVTLQGYGTATAVSYIEGLLTGVYTSTGVPTNSYVLQTLNEKQAFYLVSSEDPISAPAYRAYLTVPDAGVKAFYFDFNDATAISETLAPTGRAGEGPIFNLAGQKMSKLQKGVNIVNGKKILVK